MDKHKQNDIYSSPEKPQETTSIFFDRHDGPFKRWMEDQGLAPDAGDGLVLDAMQHYFETHNATSIAEHSAKQLHR